MYYTYVYVRATPTYGVYQLYDKYRYEMRCEAGKVAPC